MAYVYRHIRHDRNEPFYIGIGKTKYRATAKQNRNPIWGKITTKTSYDVEILFDDVSWEFACKKEIEFIKLYGRINRNTGTLANMTDGGDGNLGLVHSKEAIIKISKASNGRAGYWKGKKMSEDVKKKLSTVKMGVPNIKNIGRKMPEHVKDAVRRHSYGNKYHLGKTHTEESKKKMSESKKGKPSLSKGKKWPSHIPHPCIGRKYSEETIKKMRHSQKTRQVFKCKLDETVIEEYCSISEAARVNCVFETGIQAVCKGRAKSYKGFIWKYKNN